MPIMQSRRRFLASASLAGAACLAGAPKSAYAEPPPETTTVRLPRQIPWTVATEMLLTGDPLSGRRAYEVGLVGHVVPDGTALAKAREIADRIARNGPLAVKNIKASILAADGLPEAEAFKREMELGMATMASKDAKEGPRAFLEKREPNFTGQ